MKKLSIAIAIVLIAFSANGQDKLISINVSESIELIPVEIIYDIEIGGSATFFGMNIALDAADMSKESIEKNAKTVQDLEEFLENNEVKYEIVEYRASAKNNRSAYRTKFYNKPQFLSFQAEHIKNIKETSGNVSSVKFGKTKWHLKQFYKSLNEKAKYEAQVMADQIGMELGELLSVKEIQYNQDYWQLMGDFQNKAKDLFNTGKSIEKVIERKFTFVFSIK